VCAEGLALPPRSEIYADAAYTDYQAEDDLHTTNGITLQVARKRNSTRPDSSAWAYSKQTTRHDIETVFSTMTARFPKSIHAVTIDGFLLKLVAFVVTLTVESAFIA
jgi:hypothetical protein